MKICSHCQEVKEENEFYLKRNQCKNCRLKKASNRYKNNPELRKRKKQKVSEYQKQNKEKIKQSKTKFYELNKQQFKQKSLEYYEKNKEIIKHKKSEYYKQNKLKFQNKNQKYFKNNRNKINAHALLRYKTDIIFRLTQNYRARLRLALKQKNIPKSEKSLSFLGCSLIELKKHLESQFVEGMTWENYGPIWHVDHIIPCAAFDLSKKEEQLKCFHFTNLQSLWKEDNLLKSDKLPNGESARITKQKPPIDSSAVTPLS